MVRNQAAALDSPRVLVVEDEFLIADDLAASLRELGYGVVGPTATVGGALDLIEREPLAAALLDANLRGEGSGPVADELSNRAIPFVVLTGYGQGKLDNERLQRAPRISKPFENSALADELANLFRSFT